MSPVTARGPIVFAGNTTLPDRHAAGTGRGGQFAARHRAEGSVLLADARHSVAAVGALIRGTAASVKERALQRRPARTRPYAQRARMSVAALVLAASAASLTACGTTQENDCKPAASGISAGQATDATASFLTVPAKGGGHGSGHGSGHSSSGHTGSGHVSDGSSTGSTSGGFRWWPWSSHSSSSQQCTADAPAPKN